MEKEGKQSDETKEKKERLFMHPELIGTNKQKRNETQVKTIRKQEVKCFSQ